MRCKLNVLKLNELTNHPFCHCKFVTVGDEPKSENVKTLSFASHFD